MIAEQPDAGNHVRPATSEILERLLDGASSSHVTVAWLIDNLGARSFGIVMFLIGLLGIVPGTSPFIGILLATVAVQMIIARPSPVLPTFVAQRKISAARIARLVRLVVPVLQSLERLVRPRWRTPFEATKRVVGFAILLLGITLLAPIPFSQVIPALVIMLLAFAYLEEDGALLCVALSATALSLAITTAAAWGAFEGGRFLERLTNLQPG
jgi:hypothetical protein